MDHLLVFLERLRENLADFAEKLLKILVNRVLESFRWTGFMSRPGTHFLEFLKCFSRIVGGMGLKSPYPVVLSDQDMEWDDTLITVLNFLSCPKIDLRNSMYNRPSMCSPSKMPKLV